MSKFACTEPLTIRVFWEGSKEKKDGSPGHAVVVQHDGTMPNRKYAIQHYLPTELVDKSTGEALSESYQVPCGKCFNCRMRRKFEWSTRCIMESKMYSPDEQICVALTYDNLLISQKELAEMCTDSGRLTLVHKHFCRFMDLLRKILRKEYSFDGKLRFFMCGEYGSERSRPHFHALIFGFDFWKDAKFSHMSDTGIPLYTNSIIDRAWHRGLAEFELVDQANIKYICGYVQKKLHDNREYGDIKPPYIQMSRDPGIGRQFVIDHYKEILTSGGIYVDGRKVGIPRPFLDALVRDTPVSDRDINALKQINREAADLAEYLEVAQHGFDLVSFNRFTAAQREADFKKKSLLRGGL